VSKRKSRTQSSNPSHKFLLDLSFFPKRDPHGQGLCASGGPPVLQTPMLFLKLKIQSKNLLLPALTKLFQMLKVLPNIEFIKSENEITDIGVNRGSSQNF